MLCRHVDPALLDKLISSYVIYIWTIRWLIRNPGRIIRTFCATSMIYRDNISRVFTDLSLAAHGGLFHVKQTMAFQPGPEKIATCRQCRFG